MNLTVNNENLLEKKCNILKHTRSPSADMVKAKTDSISARYFCITRQSKLTKLQ